MLKFYPIGYKKQKYNLVTRNKITSKKGRKNNYPVVLVHGTMGFVDDQNLFLRSYWNNQFQVLSKFESLSNLVYYPYLWLYFN